MSITVSLQIKLHVLSIKQCPHWEKADEFDMKSNRAQYIQFLSDGS